MVYTTFSLVRLFSNYKAFYQNSPNVCIQQVWWQKQAPSFSNIIGKREVYGSGIFCKQIFKHNYIYCGFVFGLLFSSVGLAHCPWAY